jgi:two-component system cell cycle response regulator
MKILIVEDDPTDMKLLTAVLDASGHKVLGKTSAEAAAAEIKLHQPELILLDLKLPGMDGLTLARLLKQDPATHAIPIVALTAAREKFSRNDALAAGCDAFLVKPINTRKISEQISSVVAKPH